MNNFLWKNGVGEVLSKLSISARPNQEVELNVKYNGKKLFFKNFREVKRISGNVQGLIGPFSELVYSQIYFYATAAQPTKYSIPYIHDNGASVQTKIVNGGYLQIYSQGNFQGNYNIDGYFIYTKD